MWRRVIRWAKALKNDGLTLWFACRHPDMPLVPKILALLVVAYFLSPIDLIPDFIPVLGYLDELILLPVAIYFILKIVPESVRLECRAQAGEWTAAHKPTPRSIAGAVIVMLLWTFIFGAVWKIYGDEVMKFLGAV
jgi:uncharacterized membrane protein YkvA (DUF1232 family)